MKFSPGGQDILLSVDFLELMLPGG